MHTKRLGVSTNLFNSSIIIVLSTYISEFRAVWNETPPGFTYNLGIMIGFFCKYNEF